MSGDGDDDLFKPGERAHARGSDPYTSHAAAQAATWNLTTDQARVNAYFLRAGPEGASDKQMEVEENDLTSTLRSRRRELTMRHIIVWTGRRCHYGESKRERKVWVHREFAVDAEDVCDPPKIISAADKAEGRRAVRDLTNFAKSLMAEGRSMLAGRLTEIADLMRRLSA